jgi:hypothetical protein
MLHRRVFSQDFANRPSFPTRGSARQRHSRTAVVRAGKDLQRVQVDEDDHTRPRIHHYTAHLVLAAHRCILIPAEKMDTEKLARMQNAARTGESL